MLLLLSVRASVCVRSGPRHELHAWQGEHHLLGPGPHDASRDGGLCLPEQHPHLCPDDSHLNLMGPQVRCSS